MEYTAHVQMPDAAMGAILHDLVLEHGAVTRATLSSAQGTWLSIGYHADDDDDATVAISSIRYVVSHAWTDTIHMPEGYEPESLEAFEKAPMIVTCGRVVVFSEGI